MTYNSEESKWSLLNGLFVEFVGGTGFLKSLQSRNIGGLQPPQCMSHPEFLGNLSSRKKVKHPKRKGRGKEDLLGYTVENQHDRQGQEVNPIDAVQV